MTARPRISTQAEPEHIFFLRPPEIRRASAVRQGAASRTSTRAAAAAHITAVLSELAVEARERFELRERRKRVHPPGSIGLGDDDTGLAFKATQIKNDDCSASHGPWSHSDHQTPLSIFH
jgi:hypothetical protein